MNLHDTLEDVSVGDIIYTQDGYAYVCVPQDDAPHGKILTDGDLEFCTDQDIDFEWIILPPDMHEDTIGLDRLAVLRFVLQHRKSQATSVPPSLFWQVFNCISLN